MSDETIDETLAEMMRTKFTMTPAKLILRQPSLSSSPPPLYPLLPFEEENEVISIDENLITNYQTDWDDGIYKANSPPPSRSLSAGPDNWKKWHIMKLRKKINHLQLNDRGTREQLVERLDTYYKNLPEKIQNSQNPWICQDLENPNYSELINSDDTDDTSDNTKQPIQPIYSGSELLQPLLLEIVNILELLCQQSSPNPAAMQTKNVSKPQPSEIHFSSSPSVAQSIPLQSVQKQHQWKTVKHPSKSSMYTPEKIQTRNKFESLKLPEPTNTRSNMQCSRSEGDGVNNGHKNTNNNKVTNARRPIITTTEKYLQNMNENIKIRPGIKSYAQTASNISSVSVVTDSMCRSIRNQDINSFIDQNVESIKIYKFPGAHAKQIQHYSTWTIENESPESIVIVAGTNDINYDKNPSVAEISDRIMNIARQAKQMGVPNIFVCGIISRRSNGFDSIIKDINLALRLLSTDEGFVYISNENILKSDLNGDGLHLNPNGTKKLMHNILEHSCTPC